LLWLSETDVKSVLDPGLLVAGIEKVFTEYGRGKAVNPKETRIDDYDLPANFVAFPAYLPTMHTYAVKVLAGNDRNPARGMPFIHAVVVLLAAETGEILAVMEARYLTACRTAATSAVATKVLAKPDATCLGILGTGIQGRLHLEVVPLTRAFHTVQVCSPSGGTDRAKAMAEEAGAKFGGKPRVVACRSVVDVVRKADVLITATNSRVPLFEDDLVVRDCHVNVVGCFRPGAMEIPPRLMSRARSVVADQVQRFQGHWESEANLEFDRHVLDSVTSLAEAVTHDQTNPHPGGLSLFMSEGMAMEDAVAARLVYERAIEAGVGQRLT
jgi:ornithine cyclodeaminase/alanine dehydrogenase-like protein (mu-crystallin family)